MKYTIRYITAARGTGGENNGAVHYYFRSAGCSRASTVVRAALQEQAVTAACRDASMYRWMQAHEMLRLRY